MQPCALDSLEISVFEDDRFPPTDERLNFQNIGASVCALAGYPSVEMVFSGEEAPMMLAEAWASNQPGQSDVRFELAPGDIVHAWTTFHADREWNRCAEREAHLGEGFSRPVEPSEVRWLVGVPGDDARIEVPLGPNAPTVCAYASMFFDRFTLDTEHRFS